MTEKATSNCQNVINNMKYDLQLALLLSNIKQHPEVECRSCDDFNGQVRGYFQHYPYNWFYNPPHKVVLCTNSNKSSADFNEALKHELIHSYDVSNKRYDLGDCHGLAHSEIRAARESSCKRYYLPFDFMNEVCIKLYAGASTECAYKDRGMKCVFDAYDSAMRDLEPFAPNKEKDEESDTIVAT